LDTSQQILSDITVFSKYARFDKSKKRRETWDEIVDRNKAMHIRKYPALEQQINEAYERSVRTKNVLPSMRSLQFAGEAIERNNTRIYNCSYLPIEATEAFREIMFLLLSGTGVGYSVQKHHVAKLPTIKTPMGITTYVVPDTIEGWADAIDALVLSYFTGSPVVKFDLSQIREKGTELVVSGGRAPGPEPLRVCLEAIRKLMGGVSGRALTPIEVHDIACHMANAVLAGGIRRAAMISLFSYDDTEMLTCKSGKWWIENPQRGRANNSVVLERHIVTEKQFFNIWDIVKASGAGEPGFYWTNDKELGTNPCAEIALEPYQFCNLTEINASTIVSQEDFSFRAIDAAFIGTLQAGYTDFHYLRPIWKTTTEEQALLGVGITGIASGKITQLDEELAARNARVSNLVTATRIGIYPAARVTTVKPSGTTSLVVGSSSGIHAWHAPYYIRRMYLGKDEAICKYLQSVVPDLLEDERHHPELQSVLSIPQKAPEGAILRTESALELLDRVNRYNTRWVKPGHIYGANTNNVSVTVSVKENEWSEVGLWMWNNRNTYNGISVLPYDGGTYIQAPFEDITKEKYEKLSKHLHGIDLTKVKEVSDNTDLIAELACAGNGCEVDFDIFEREV
jgi:ribonucleoside-diphosphate reductase alpha chain